ncbi:MAG: hypothetical protein Q9209_005596 [Squamulea sp. 1 TL-2023]
MTSTRAASTVTRSAKSWADCAVHVKIFPRPGNLAESREVLRVLQQYGEVVMYRHLKYEAPNPTLNAALAIYRTQNSAYNVVQASPIHFQLQQGKDGWISKISRDASAEGSLPRSGADNEAPMNDFPDENLSTPDTFNLNLRDDDLEGSPQPQTSYPHDYSADVSPKTHSGSDGKWDSNLFAQAMEKDGNTHGPAKDTSFGAFSSNFGPPETPKKETTERPSRKSARQLAEQLIAHAKSASSSSNAKIVQNTSAPVQEFQLTVVKSFFNHQAYIERQAYYAGFNPNMKTIMAGDLKGRVPSEGYLDCSLNKGDLPLRIRLKKKEQNRSHISLMELWETGKRERGEV